MVGKNTRERLTTFETFNMADPREKCTGEPIKKDKAGRREGNRRREKEEEEEEERE